MNSDAVLRDKLLDITKSFLVQAPAGSGKTSILVQRYLNALSAVQSDPEEVLAITFTRKAATEMRERILNALQAAASDAAPPNGYAAKLQVIAKKVIARDNQAGWQLLNNPARLKIQTIDALCATITKQMPILSRFGSQPQIDQQPEALYAKAVDQLLQMLDQEHAYSGQDSLMVLLRHLDNDRPKVKKLLMQMLANREHWLPTIVQYNHTKNLRCVLEEGLLHACEEALEDLNQLVPPVLDVRVMNHTEPQSVTEWLAVIDKLLTRDGTWRKTVTAAQGFFAPSSACNKQEKARLQEAKTAMLTMLERLRVHEDFRHSLIALRELPPLNYSDKQWIIVEALLDVLPLLAAQLTLVFKDHGHVDFIAVALAAISALQVEDAPTDVALALDCKLRHILVDEFQDTSHIQFKLLELLTLNWQQDDGRTLFLVGDPMQSIYSFRQADVGLFIKAREQGIGNVSLDFVQLTTNFRSTVGVVNWINNVFTHSFPRADNKTLGAVAYTSAQAADTGIPMDAVQCIAVTEDLEPGEIVKIVKDNRKNNPKASIAILVRAKSHLYKILPMLRAAQINYQGVEIENLHKRPVIQDLLALTQAILHLDDRIAWLAILRAPWCGIPLSDLQLIAQADGTILTAIQNADVYNELTPSTQLRIARFRAVLHDAITLRGRLPISNLVEKVMHDLGIMDYLPEDQLAEVEAFFDLLERLAHKPEIYSPGYFSQELQNLFLASQNADPMSVQIMTIHKAKGLEFDVVILPSLHKTTRSFDAEVLLLEQRDYMHQYLLLAPIRAADQTEDPIYNYMAWCKQQREEYETLRQLYVAMTRAKQKIYCLAQVSSEFTPSGMLKRIWSHVATQFVNSAQDQEYAREPDISLRRLPIAWYTAHKTYQPITRTVEKYKARPWQPNWVNVAGTILHRILCHIGTVGIENIEQWYLQNLPAITLNLMRAMAVLPSDVQKIRKLILQALNVMLKDSLGVNILSAKHLESYTEWSLTSLVEEEFITIRLDRVFVDQANILWLVDYKLVPDAENLRKAVQVYAAQIHQYVRLLKLLRPKAKIKGGLYFPLQAHWQVICECDIVQPS